MFIDLRSDTVTKPTAEMLEKMFSAEVGDDVFGEDKTIKKLEQKLADMFGFEAGIFCPSGTMTNQIAIFNHTNPGDQIICDATSHVYNYEVGGMAIHSQISARCIQSEKGKITPEDVLNNINPDDFHYPKTAIVALENTCNKGGGIYYTIEEMKAISEVAKRNGLKMHLDGARVFNAIVADNQETQEYGKIFDTVSICLSKGLGCPIGSILLGSKNFIQGCFRTRKLFGGGMRQVGYLGEAGIYALDNNIERLEEDHKLAKQIKEILLKLDYVEKVLPVETNIIIFKLKDTVSSETFLNYLTNKKLGAVDFGANKVRFVTHMGVDEQILTPMQEILNSFQN